MAIPVQQATPFTQASGTTASLVFPASVTVGNLVTVILSQSAGAAAVSISGLGATWTQIDQNNLAGPNQGTALWAAICVTAGTTISLSGMASTASIGSAQEWSGYQLTGFQLGHNSASAATSVASNLPASAEGTALLVIAVSVSVNETITSPGGAWNTLTVGTGQTGVIQAASWQAITVKGTNNGTWTFASANAVSVGGIFPVVTVVQPPLSPPMRAGMVPWVAPVAQMRSTTAPFHAANPPSYDQHLAPIPARQQGMAGWWAPVPALHPTIAPFNPANPPSYDHHLAPIPAVQAGMKPWWAPVPGALQATTLPFSPANPPSFDHHLAPIPAVQSGMAGWWAPVPSLHPTIAPFNAANPPQGDQQLFPIPAVQLGMAPWWAPVVRMRHTIAPFQVANPPEFTTYKIPLAIIQQGWWAPPALLARGSPNDAGAAPPPPGVDPIVIWRHRAGMQ